VVRVQAGNGGNGCWAYERAKYKPKGPPSGGSGGRGGHISIRGNTRLHTLQDLAYRKHFQAGRGAHGKGSDKDGRNGEDVTVDVPLGTMVYDDGTGELLLDCIREGEETIIARGGRGGRGNAALRSGRNRNPETVEVGSPGEDRRLRLVLKVLADVGLVGRPNAGKSTFLARISHAHPKIAGYPFTTTTPHLGIVTTGSGYGSFVVADIPGLIEGSHTGRGLGIRFLRHIERTRVLAILVESTSEDPAGDARVLRAELSAYDPLLAKKPAVCVLTKSDLLPADRTRKLPRGWLAMSAVTGEGVERVLRRLEEMLK
jgi:GTP-binding protein